MKTAIQILTITIGSRVHIIVYTSLLWHRMDFEHVAVVILEIIMPTYLLICVEVDKCHHHHLCSNTAHQFHNHKSEVCRQHLFIANCYLMQRAQQVAYNALSFTHSRSLYFIHYYTSHFTMHAYLQKCKVMFCKYRYLSYSFNRPCSTCCYSRHHCRRQHTYSKTKWKVESRE